jgi:hypothetical protein
MMPVTKMVVGLPTHHDEFSKELNISKMIEKVNHFKLCGDKIIQKIIRSIDEIDKSDEEIINLI